MDPSERIHLKKAIIHALERTDWTEVDLILSEFGLPTADRWEGDPPSYLLWSLGEASDDTLRGVAHHLKIGGGGTSQDDSPLPGFWKPGAFRLFISHLAKQKGRAIKLRTELLPLNVSCFVAHEDIEPTADWQREIESALRTMDALLALVTPGFRESAWADQEVGFALGRGKLVVPLKVDGQDPHGFIARHQAASALKGDTSAVVAQKVYQALRNHEATSEQVASALVAQFEESTSAHDALSALEHLDQFGSLSNAQMNRIKAAYNANPIVGDAQDLDFRINSLLSKYGYSGQMIPTPMREDDIPF